jgi:uncharacterized protein
MPRPEAWIASSIAALNRTGSWTGRIHVHKLLYLAKALDLSEPPFDFVLYQYGPYSYDLDAAIAQMDLYGLVVKSYPNPRYGPKYVVTELGAEEASQLDAGDLEALNRLARQLGDCDSQSLELQATCLWVEQEEGVTDDAEIVRRVKHLKPKYDDTRIDQALKAVQRLAASLAH